MSNLVNEIIAANLRIKAVKGGVRETPLDFSGVFSERTGADFLQKGEHLQNTGSFKLRGALNKILTLGDEERSQGIVTASSGNHGAAVSLAASIVGIEATIYLPETVSSAKHDKIKRNGAKTVLVPGNGVEAENIAHATADRENRTYVSPYSDLDVMAGQGTVGLELAEQCPDLAAVYVSVGGGGLIAGIGSYLKEVCPDVDVIACWAENSKALYHCIEKGEVHEVPETKTLSDGTAGGIEAGAITLPICTQVIDRAIFISEDEIASAVRDMAVYENFIIEGAAGVALAAGLKDASKYKGRPVAVVICGRNIAAEVFLSVMTSDA
jgi:threonine dehydratase